jgi:TonB family protein
MNVKASEAMGEAWAALAGHVVNGVFPLRCYLGGSDHSGVFLTTLSGHEPSDVALKLVAAPATPALADLQLSRWLSAARLDHPHLLQSLGAGRCEIDGMRYLYTVMEYADQNLAQLLAHRALTEDEAREMLVPALSALRFLHDRKCVQGRVRPSNVLVVGDQLKLASDTIRPVGEALDGMNALSMYDAPEVREGSWSSAGDVWALGVTVCEALTRRQPSGLREGAGEGSLALPSDLPSGFRELVSRCVSRRASDRPSVVELEAWVSGKQTALAPPAVLRPEATIALLEPSGAPAVASGDAASMAHAALSLPMPPVASHPAVAVPPGSRASIQPAQPVPPVSHAPIQPAEPVAPASSGVSGTDGPVPPASSNVSRPGAAAPPGSSITVQPFTPAPAVSETAATQSASVAQPPKRRAVSFILGAVIVIAVGWVGMRAFRSNDATAELAAGASTPPATEAVQEPGDRASAESQTSDAPLTPAASLTSSDVASVPSRTVPPIGADAALSPAVVHQEIPDVPQRARQTIRGHVKVTVRVMVNPDGTVFAALTDKPGPSRYFERLALEAAKKWTFAPMGTEDQHIVVLRFDFSREGATARAVTVQ